MDLELTCARPAIVIDCPRRQCHRPARPPVAGSGAERQLPPTTILGFQIRHSFRDSIVEHSIITRPDSDHYGRPGISSRRPARAAVAGRVSHGRHCGAGLENAGATRRHCVTVPTARLPNSPRRPSGDHTPRQHLHRAAFADRAAAMRARSFRGAQKGARASAPRSRRMRTPVPATTRSELVASASRLESGCRR